MIDDFALPRSWEPFSSMSLAGIVKYVCEGVEGEDREQIIKEDEESFSKRENEQIA